MSYLYRYARWDGTQRVFDLDDEALMDGLCDELMENGDVRHALRNLLRWGARDHREGNRLEGLWQIMERLRN